MADGKYEKVSANKVSDPDGEEMALADLVIDLANRIEHMEVALHFKAKRS